MPKNKPVLLAPNHQNSFIDGILLSVLLRNKLTLLARGDAFKKPFGNWALRSMRLLPIYRATDGAGAEQSAKNQETFDQCYEIFRKNGKVLIFPEGYSVAERRLKPMKKGAAKMAFEAIEKYPDMDLQIMPVGMNYSNSGHFREEVCINFGKPIAVQNYKQLLLEGKHSKAATELNSLLYEAMERELVIIKESANDRVGHQYLIMARNQYKPGFFGFIKRTKKRFLAEKRAANDLNNLSENNPESFETFRRNVTDYFQKLKSINIRDKYFAIPVFEKVLYTLFTILFFIPALVGLVLNFLPVRMAKYAAIKKVTRADFFDSVYMGSLNMISMIYTIIILIICMLFFGWKGVIITLVIRLLGFLFLFWQEAALNTKYWIIILFTHQGRIMRKPLKSQRTYILNYFG